jgi:DNA polymerase III subunit gamma/tau
MALALARKYRPKRFSDLIAQDHVAMVLRGAVFKNRVGHGYLLTGPRGVGKTTAARILAMALNCERRGGEQWDGEPCGACESCTRIWTGAAGLDVVELDAASNRGVDDARDLRERAMYAASQEGHHKVYIVDEAHMLTREAWNALLKILEEPPPRVVFVFATTEPQKIAQAAAPVLSRLQRFDFRRIAARAIQDRLTAVLRAEQIEADEDGLILIARQADGGMRDALSVLDQCLSFGEGRVTAARVREVLGLVTDEVMGELLDILADRRPAGVFPLIDRLLEAGADLTEFAGGAAEALRAVLQLQLGGTPEGMTEGLRLALDRVRGRLPAGDVLRMLKLFTETEANIRRSGSPRLVIETLLLRWALMDRTVDLEAVLGGGSPDPGATRGGTSGVPRLKDLTQSGETIRPAPRRGPEAGSVPSTSSAPSASFAPSAPSALSAPSAVSAPFTFEGLTGAWPDLVAGAREASRFLGEAMAGATLVSVVPPLVHLAPAEGNAIQAESLERQLLVIEGLISRAVSAQVRVSLAAPSVPGPSPRSRRLSEAESRAERLRMLRAKDPALEAAAEGLDLEALE